MSTVPRPVRGEAAVRMQKCFSPGVIGIRQEEGQQVGVWRWQGYRECQEYQILLDINGYIRLSDIVGCIRYCQILSDLSDILDVLDIVR